MWVFSTWSQSSGSSLSSGNKINKSSSMCSKGHTSKDLIQPMITQPHHIVHILSSSPSNAPPNSWPDCHQEDIHSAFGGRRNYFGKRVWGTVESKTVGNRFGEPVSNRLAVSAPIAVPDVPKECSSLTFAPLHIKNQGRKEGNGFLLPELSDLKGWIMICSEKSLADMLNFQPLN